VDLITDYENVLTDSTLPPFRAGLRRTPPNRAAVQSRSRPAFRPDRLTVTPLLAGANVLICTVGMKVKTPRETVTKFIGLLETFDASTEQFVDGLPTPEKYAILAMAMMVQGYDDFEEAYDDATHKVSAQELTKHLLKYPFLDCHLQDALRLGWETFEFGWRVDEDEDEEEA